MKYIFIIGFVVMIVAQWFVPLSMIFEAEKTIDDGAEYKFKTAPIDPSDPFRGKFITLSFDAETYVPVDTNQLNFQDGSFVYAQIGIDSEGFARIEKLSNENPEGDFMKIEFNYAYKDRASLEFPFKRFYLEESKASEAERIYWQNGRDSTTVCFAKVKILNGDAKLTDVIINDSSIVDVVRRINANKED